MDRQAHIPQRKIWFKAKEHGYGWSPASWQGWGTVLLYLCGVIYFAWDILSGITSGIVGVRYFLIRVIALSILLFYVAYTKGEPPRWR